MTDALTHRGPDEAGFFEDPVLSLGVRRLRVIDLKTGSQPISNEDGTIHIVANCEIYDYESIRSRLQSAHQFRSRSDTEILLHLYEEHGLGLFDHFDGMFALALWDAGKQRLLLARDRFGIKPLFYTLPSSDGSFAFSSEIGPLRHLPLATASSDLDPSAIDEFFALSFIPHPRTAYRSIRKLGPACCLVAEKGRFCLREYWKLECAGTPVDERLALEELDNSISRSVQRMMRSDVPVGAFLSGGLDSSTVVYHMAHRSSAPVQTFSLRFPDKRFDEGELALATSRALGTDHHELWIRPEQMALASGIISHFGEPLADPSQIPTYLICREARKAVTVLLSGDGGDEILGGYPAYCATLLASRLPRPPEPFLLPIRRAPRLSARAFPRLARLEERLRKFLNGYHLPCHRRHALWRTIMTPAERQAIYSREFRASLIERTILSAWDPLFDDDLDELTKCQQLDIKTYLTDNCLAKVDRMSMANSLEVRVPLLDLEVVRAAMRLPPHLRVQGLQTKVALRRIMKGRVPETVRRMPKKGFPVPLASWFRGSLRSYVEENLTPDRLQRLPVLSASGVHRIVRRHLDGAANCERQIWSLICFVHWCEQQRAI